MESKIDHVCDIVVTESESKVSKQPSSVGTCRRLSFLPSRLLSSQWRVHDAGESHYSLEELSRF